MTCLLLRARDAFALIKISSRLTSYDITKAVSSSTLVVLIGTSGRGS